MSSDPCKYNINKMYLCNYISSFLHSISQWTKSAEIKSLCTGIYHPLPTGFLFSPLFLGTQFPLSFPVGLPALLAPNTSIPCAAFPFSAQEAVADGMP